MIMTQPESKLSLDIQKALKARGAYVWKVHGNEYTPAGTPDIVGVYRGQFIAVETKMPGNTCTAIQEYRIGRMRIAGAYVCAPCYSVAEALEMIDLYDEMIMGDPSTHGSPGWHTEVRMRRAYGITAVFR